MASIQFESSRSVSPDPFKPMDPSKPAIIIVHADFLSPVHYEPLIEALHSKGFSYVSCPRRATAEETADSEATITDDVQLIRNSIETLSSTGTAFIILAHDFGGLVANEALRSTDLLDRRQNPTSHRGGIVQIVYLSGWIIPPGNSFENAAQGCETKSTLELQVTDRGTLKVQNAREALFNGVEEGNIAKLTSSVVEMPASVRYANATKPTWRSIPCTYIYCKQNNAIPLELQQMMVRHATASGGVLDLREEELDGGFASFLTHIREIVQVLTHTAELERDRFWIEDDDGIPRMGPLLTMDF